MNRFVAAWYTIWPESITKEWSPGIHTQIYLDKTHKFYVYGTNHHNEKQFFENAANFDQSHLHGKVIAFFNDNHCTMVNYDNHSNRHEFVLYGDEFMYDGVMHQYKSCPKIGGYDQITTYKYYSLVKMMIQYNKRMGLSKIYASKGGKANKHTSAIQAANRTKIWIKMTFDEANSEPKIEKKSSLDCYKILAGKYGYDKTYMTFTRFLKKLGQNEARFEHKKAEANVIINLWQDTAPGVNIENVNTNYNTIVLQGKERNLEEIQENSLNLDLGTIIVGVNTPSSEQSSSQATPKYNTIKKPENRGKWKRTVKINDSFLRKYVKTQIKLQEKIQFWLTIYDKNDDNKDNQLIYDYYANRY